MTLSDLASIGSLVSGIAVLVSLVYLSLQIDLPTGATIVCTFGIVLILMALFRVLILRGAAAKANLESLPASAVNR